MESEILQNINVLVDKQENETVCMIQGKDSLPTQEELGKIHLNILLDSSGSMSILIPNSIQSFKNYDLTLVEDDPPLKCTIKKKHYIASRAIITRIGILTALYSDLFQLYDTTFRILCYNDDVTFDSGILALTKENVANITQTIIDVPVKGSTQVYTAFEEINKICDKVDSDRKFITILLTDGYDHSDVTIRDNTLDKIKENIGEREHLMITMGIGVPNTDFDSVFLCKYTTLKSVTDNKEAIYGETCEEMNTVCVKGYSKLLSKISYFGMVKIVLDNDSDSITNFFDPSDSTSCGLFKIQSNQIVLNVNNINIPINIDTSSVTTNNLVTRIDGLSYYYDTYIIINTALELLQKNYSTYSEKYHKLSNLTRNVKDIIDMKPSSEIFRHKMQI